MVAEVVLKVDMCLEVKVRRLDRDGKFWLLGDGEVQHYAFIYT